MIKSSSKYNMAYYNINQLESKLNKENLSTSLWIIPKSRLTAAFSDVFPNSIGMVFNFLKDIHTEKNLNGDTLFRGLFVVLCDKNLTETEMQILLTQYLTEHPEIDRSIKSTNKSQPRTENIVDLDIEKEVEDLNALADNLEQDNLIYGVLDDFNHLQALSKIEGIDIIKNFGDFKKIYFSIPSFRQDEVLAHSVTILKQIKCKRALLDFITE